MCMLEGGGGARRPRQRPRKSAGCLEGAVSKILDFRYSGRLELLCCGVQSVCMRGWGWWVGLRAYQALGRQTKRY